MTETTQIADAAAGLGTKRSRRPVFVMGCHRSGTNLLYDTLLSAGGFPIYRGYLPVYKILIPRYGDPRNAAARRRIVKAFLDSQGFARTGLSASELSAELLEHAGTGGDFLRIVMEKVAQAQHAQRWAVYDPDAVLHIPRIKFDLPESLFIHIIRDGRDVALSLAKMGGFRPFPWSRRARGLLETSLYWQWMVESGREYGREMGADYIEMHYEDLIANPRATLERLGQFLDHDLDHERIQSNRIGSLLESNSSFAGENSPGAPLYRWKQRLSQEDIARLEYLTGSTLEACGYSLTTPADQRSVSLRWKTAANFYPRFLDAKLWLKLHTPLGRFSSLSALEPSDAGEN